MSEEAPPAELVAGKYKLTRMLGRGGMGSVWEGVHASLGTKVACKFIEAEFAGSSEARDRFENEARAAAALRSKHVVEVYDHGVMADGRPYIVMEFLSGEPLDARLARVGALPIDETAKILHQVARALEKAHSLGIVHRDLKPENVFLVWDDEDQADIVKVVDFGIAKFTDASAVGISSATRTGSVLGTPFYMSPEQARGLRSVDARSDLWSLGVITFQCLTGQLPFNGEAVGDLLVRICTADPVAPTSLNADLPPEIDRWMARALSREPDGRFSSAREMTEALAEIAGVAVRSRQSSVLGTPAGYGQSRGSTPGAGAAGAATNAALEKAYITGSSAGGNKMLLGIGAGVVALIAVGAVLLLSGGETPDETAASAEPPASAIPAAQPEPAETADAASEVPADEPEKAKEDLEPEPEAKEPEPEPTPPPVRPAPRPRAVPRPVAAPRPAPAPAPAPAPQRRNPGIDLGY